MRRHDPFLKALYKCGLPDALRLFFPELAAHVDWSDATWDEQEVPILGEEPRAVVADLVARVHDAEGSELEILVHPELQGDARKNMGWRVLQYNAGLTLQQGSPNARVVTIVFYHCKGGRGIREERHALTFAGRSVLEVGYWVVGLGELDAAKYAESDNPMGWALAGWMKQPKRGRAALRLRLLANVLRFVHDEYYRKLLVDALRTYFRLSPKEEQEEQELLASPEYAEVEEMYDTVLGRMETDAERRAAHRALLTLLEARFSPLPKAVERRIQQVKDLAALDALVRRAATATSLDEVWAAPVH